MNLHIVPDNVFTNRFYENLVALNIVGNNRIIVRMYQDKYVHIVHDLKGAAMYTKEFDSYVGDVSQYDKVFIHLFTPLMYKWVAKNTFKELNWMIWGADLYNLPSESLGLYEILTEKKYVKRRWSLNQFLYRMKILITNRTYKRKAYSKVDYILTWMASEFEFARTHLPVTRAQHKFFFYENKISYETLDKFIVARPKSTADLPTIVIGNSSTPTLNHLDVLVYLQEAGIKANVKIPLSYGESAYTDFLKLNHSIYSIGKVELITDYMPFEKYVAFLSEADAIIMYNTRPQGYGNIFIMMYLGKSVILNSKNNSVSDLDRNSLKWFSLDDLRNMNSLGQTDNKTAVVKLLSHERLLGTYRRLFS